MLTTVVIVAALVAGVTGAWSPCGFSMVETLAPSGYAQRLRTTAIACATFAAGALVGGVITFGGLALLGAALGANAPYVAAAIALIAAAGEARNLRIVPQVRRQVPESWRRVMPVPLAAGLYGVLLGLGFTTFILTFAVWALAGISVAVGDPATGVAIGLAFGVGRALPVIALAPSGGGRLHAAMAERPRILRSLRALDAAALAVTALTLATAPAQAAVSVFAVGYADAEPRRPAAGPAPPRRPGRDPRARGHAARCPATTRRSAAGGPRTSSARRSRSRAGRRSRRPAPTRSRSPRPGWRGTRRAPSTPRRCTRRPSRARWSPATSAARCSSGNLLVYAIDGRIEAIDLVTGVHQLLRREARAELRGPSVDGYRLTYIKATYKRQQVLTGVLLPRRTELRPHALRHHAHGQPRRRPRARARPRPRPHQQAALAATARRASRTR